MTIRISKLIVVDGIEMNVSAEGGSAKEALSIVDAAAEELGAAPQGEEAAIIVGKRKRRTKEEMAAARQAAAAGAQALLPGVPAAEPARVFAPPETRFTPPGPLPPAAILPGEPNIVTWDDSPPLPQEERSVGFEAPPPAPPAFGGPPAPSFEPPPVKSEEQLLREQIDAEIQKTIAMEPSWRDAIIGAYHKAAAPFGGDIFAMGVDNLRTVLAGVLTYQRKVDEAVKARR